MSVVNADRNLLFGLIALQNGLIDQDQLVGAFRAWSRDKGAQLAEYLINRGDLNADQRGVVQAMVELHEKKHGGSTEKSLAAMPAGKSTLESLARIRDPDIEATLGHVASAHASTDSDPDRTGTYSVGSVTSDGLRFRILRPHARGGLGAVFVALDGELNREVALKQILDQHADDAISRQRFLLEAEITGGLEHPGIVPIYGLGTYSDGRPYYAMRFIKGDSLKEAIELFHKAGPSATPPVAGSLELRKLLRRFTDVCNAIDYAHARGVLHRDIKPGNIIVGKHGETLVVDWGLAKPLGRAEPGADLGERTLMPSSASGSAETLPGSALGTPSYMSPEQAVGDLDRLGPRSDVYSLGATLYCLLTGKPPFEGDDLGAILRSVRKGDFRPPRQLDPSIDKALEEVCLKAMALRPEDRYASSRALADDIERWLADEPVSAWPEPLPRRARRWAKQNRTAVTGAAIALVAGVIGLSAVIVVQTQAKAGIAAALGRETLANGQLAEANRLAEKANAELTNANADLADANRREAERFELAMAAIRLFHGEVSQDLMLKEKAFAGLRDRLLQGASDFYARLAGALEAKPDPRSRAALAAAYFDLGDLNLTAGKFAEATAIHRKALELRRALASGSGPDARLAVEAARSEYNLGQCLQFTSAPDALAYYRQAAARLEKQETAGHLDDRGRRLLAEVLLLISYFSNSADRVAPFREAEAITRRIAEPSPDDTQGREAMAGIYDMMGCCDAIPPGEQVPHLRRALASYERLYAEKAGVARYVNQAARVHNNLSVALEQLGQMTESETELARAVELWNRVSEANPGVPMMRNNLAFGLNSHANTLNRLSRFVEATASARRAATLYAELALAQPDVPHYRSNLAKAYRFQADALRGSGRPAEAARALRASIAAYGQVAKAKPIDLYIQAGAHALLCGLAGTPGSGLAEPEGRAEADHAMAFLRRALDADLLGEASVTLEEIRSIESALAPLRDRADFKLLIMDLGMPKQPFADSN